MVNALRKILRSYWFNTLFGVVVLAILIWFFGPMLAIGQVHPFDSEMARLIAIYTICPGTCSSARPARARRPRWSIRA